jgi:uncharacterized membrane protein
MNKALRLVVLNSCEGAKGGELDIYSSTAAILVRRGIAAVLAMQYAITDRAAIEFSRAFYEALADGQPIDAAVASARIAVNIEINNSLEWGTPVLFMRSPDGVLFELEAPEQAPPAPPQEIQPARLRVDTAPLDAAITILNLPTGFTQGQELEPGNYDLEVSAEGYETKKELVNLAAGEDKQVKVVLQKLQGRLWIKTDPPDATVIILNHQTEFSQGQELEPGRYELSVSAAGHETTRVWFELGAGEEKRVRITLQTISRWKWLTRVAAGLPLLMVLIVRITLQKISRWKWLTRVAVGLTLLTVLIVVLYLWPPGKVRLYVDTTPPEAVVRLLNLSTAFSQGMELAPGQYEIVVSAPGYEAARHWLQLVAGEDQRFSVSLTKVRPRLSVETLPQGAQIRIINPAVEFSQGMQLAPGRYEILVAAGGYETKREWVELAAGKDTHIKITLLKAKAHLWVDTEPQNANVKILNLEKKFTQGMELAPGRYEIVVSAPGCEAAGQWIELVAGEEKRHPISLTKVKPRLSVETFPKDAQIRIINPEVAFSQGMQLAPGRYEIEVSAQGYRTVSQRLELVAGEDQRLTISLTRASSRVWVTGKTTVKLSVETFPPSAQIRIILPTGWVIRFSQGMRLAPGRYEIEVSAQDYRTVSQRLELVAGEDRCLKISLPRNGPQWRVGPSQGGYIR